MSCTLRWGSYAPGVASSSESGRQRDRTKAPALRKSGKCERGEGKEERPDMKPLLTAGPWLVLLFFLGGESASVGGRRHGSKPAFISQPLVSHRQEFDPKGKKRITRRGGLLRVEMELISTKWNTQVQRMESRHGAYLNRIKEGGRHVFDWCIGRVAVTLY